MLRFFGCKTCGILASQTWIEPSVRALKDEVLTTGPPGNSQNHISCVPKFVNRAMSLLRSLILEASQKGSQGSPRGVVNPPPPKPLGIYPKVKSKHRCEEQQNYKVLSGSASPHSLEWPILPSFLSSISSPLATVTAC